MSKFDTVEAPKINKPVQLKEWTSLDHITHDFTDSDCFRRYCLDKYGQYMGCDGVRVTVCQR